MPTVTDWISSVAAIIGSLTAVGALVVSLLSYRKANRALAADRATRSAIESAAVDGVVAAGSTVIGGLASGEVNNIVESIVEPVQVADGQVAYLRSLVQNLEKLRQGENK